MRQKPHTVGLTAYAKILTKNFFSTNCDKGENQEKINKNKTTNEAKELH